MFNNARAIARVYASAAFKFAKENNKIDIWEKELKLFSIIIKNSYMKILLKKSIESKILSIIFISVCEDYKKNKLNNFFRNFIKIVSVNNRLFLMSIILEEFLFLKNEYQNIVTVTIISAKTLNYMQLENINYVLSKKLLRKINIICKIDESIISGILIYINNKVFDASIRSRIERMKNIL